MNMNIGVAAIDSELTKMITSHPIEHSYSLSKIAKKDNLSDLGGLIIPINKKDQFIKVIDWTLASQKIPNMFVWVFLNEEVEFEEDVLRRLGVNEVIEGHEHLPRLFLSIGNLVSKLPSNSSGQKSNNYKLLNLRNQSIYTTSGSSISLTRTECLLLEDLQENIENTIPYKDLMVTIWPNDPPVNKFRLANTIFHLRKKIEKNTNYNIINVRSKGYMLTNVLSNSRDMM